MAWTRMERLNVEGCGQTAMHRVGVFQPAELMAGAAFIIAWRPRKGTTGPGFCLAPHASMGQPFPYQSDTKLLEQDIEAEEFLALAAELVMNGAPFALLDAAFLVFPTWRALTVRGYVAHTPDGAWNPHNPDDAEEKLQGYRGDHGMFQRRIDHDRKYELPTVEIVRGFGRASE